MYFITKRTSKTGQKFEAIDKRQTNVMDACWKIAHDLGFKQFYNAYGVAFGGISAVRFDKEPDLNVWKVNKDGVATPRKSTKEGKLIDKMFKKLQTIPIEDLNSIVNVDYDFQRIGFNFSHSDLIGFEVWDNVKEFQPNWKAPKDCEEVTKNKYNQLLAKKESLQ